MQTESMYSVVEFAGFRITGNIIAKHSSVAKPQIDWHVVDERGRTQRVFPAPYGVGLRHDEARRVRAQDYADDLNAAHSREAVPSDRETGA